jgi:hypothetical protein
MWNEAQALLAAFSHEVLKGYRTPSSLAIFLVLVIVTGEQFRILAISE